jgi:hypothetical protein
MNPGRGAKSAAMARHFQAKATANPFSANQATPVSRSSLYGSEPTSGAAARRGHGLMIATKVRRARCLRRWRARTRAVCRVGLELPRREQDEMPTVAASHEPSRDDQFGLALEGCAREGRPLKSGIVKPMPARNAVPTRCSKALRGSRTDVAEHHHRRDQRAVAAAGAALGFGLDDRLLQKGSGQVRAAGGGAEPQRPLFDLLARHQPGAREVGMEHRFHAGSEVGVHHPGGDLEVQAE